MASKDRELHYLQILREKLGDFPEGAVVPDEEPDFLISTREGPLGIEVRQIFKSDDNRPPRQATESEARCIVAQAQETAVNRDLPGLAVAVTFSPYTSLKKSARSQHAASLFEAIAKHMPEEGRTIRSGHDLDLPWKDLPKFVSQLRIFRPPEPCAHFWRVHGGGWVQTDCVDLLTEAIDAKNKLLSAYLDKCSRCWLVLAAEGFDDSNLIQPAQESAQHIYHSLFDRTFYLEVFSRNVVELRTSKGAGGGRRLTLASSGHLGSRPSAR